MTGGWLFLAAMIVAYGVANLLQSIAAANTDLHQGFSPRLLWRLGQHRAYLFGIGFQFVAFALAFLARRDLPLFLVQSAVAAGLGVTAVVAKDVEDAAAVLGAMHDLAVRAVAAKLSADQLAVKPRN